MNGIGDKWEMRKEALEAVIAVIPKEGKETARYVLATDLSHS